MRVSLVGTAALVVVLTAASAARAASSLVGTMVDPGPPGYDRDACGGAAVMVPDAGFTNGVSKGKFKFGAPSCKGIIKLSSLTTLPVSDGIAATGDEAVCLVNFQSNAPALSCGTFLLRGEITGTPATQAIKIKLSGPTQLPAGVCPLAAGSDARITSVECFVPAPGYGAAACGGGFTPFITDPTQGLCFPAPAYMPNPPGTPVIAVQGLLF